MMRLLNENTPLSESKTPYSPRGKSQKPSSPFCAVKFWCTMSSSFASDGTESAGTTRRAAPSGMFLRATVRDSTVLSFLVKLTTATSPRGDGAAHAPKTATSNAARKIASTNFIITPSEMLVDLLNALRLSRKQVLPSSQKAAPQIGGRSRALPCRSQPIPQRKQSAHRMPTARA